MAEAILLKVSSPELKAFEDVRSDLPQCIEMEFLSVGKKTNKQKKKRNLSLLKRDKVPEENAILTSAKNGYLDDTLTLLKFYENKYDISTVDCYGYDVFYYGQANTELVRYILENNKNEIFFNKIYPSGESVLDILIKLRLERLIMDNFHLFNYESLTKIDNMHRSTLILACKNSLYLLCKQLVMFGVNVFQYDIEGKNMMYYLIQNSFTQDCITFALWFINYNHNQQVYEPFHRFNEDDIIVYDRIANNNNSNYSAVYHGIDKKTSNTIILKKCIKYIPFDIISPDITKEIVFLLNLKREQMNVVNILGYYISPTDEFFLVFEPLAITLYDYFKILRETDMSNICSPTGSPVVKKTKGFSTFQSEENTNYVEDLYYRLVESITSIHKLGMLHNDLKLENIMLTYGGNIRIIDFGISNFFGISPNVSTVCNYISSAFIKAPDDLFRIQYEICNSSEVPQGKYTYQNNRKSYDSDMYSFANSMIQGIFGSTSRYLIVNDIFYKVITPKDPNQLQKLIPLSTNRVKKLQSYTFFDNLRLMIDINCNKRIHRTKTIMNVAKYIPEPDKKRIVVNNLHYTEDEIMGQQRELIYLEDIYTRFVNHTFQTNQIKDVKEIINKILSRYKSKISYDTLINTLYHTNNCNTNPQYNDYVFVCFFYIFSSIFETNIYDSSEICQLINKDISHMISFANDLILKNISSINITSFVSVVASKVIELQKENKKNIQSYEIQMYKQIIAKINTLGEPFSLNDILS